MITFIGRIWATTVKSGPYASAKPYKAPIPSNVVEAIG
jgi:hypothetical protein